METDQTTILRWQKEFSKLLSCKDINLTILYPQLIQFALTLRHVYYVDKYVFRFCSGKKDINNRHLV